jgi:hypothetical protein
MNRFVLVILLAAAAAGCRQHPCGDDSAELPSVFGSAPVLVEDGRVCQAQADGAIAMYWGDKTRMSQIVRATLARMDGAGWAQYEAKGEYAPFRDPDKPTLVFRKGNEEIGISFHPTQTPRFGSKLWTDSVTVHLSHRTRQDKERRAR